MLLPAPTRKDRLGGALSWPKPGRANQLIAQVSMMDFESNRIIFQIFVMNRYFYQLINIYTQSCAFVFDYQLISFSIRIIADNNKSMSFPLFPLIPFSFIHYVHQRQVIGIPAHIFRNQCHSSFLPNRRYRRIVRSDD